jgi:hypothetical protein
MVKQLRGKIQHIDANTYEKISFCYGLYCCD